jgi:large subunit ribosomal protein L25
MSQITLHASTSRAQGSSNARRLRSTGAIPAVIYGEGVTPLPVAVNAKDFRTAVSGDQGLNSVITLDADGQTYTVLAREIQRHPVRGTVSHIDFQVVDPNRPVVAEVPLHIIGDAVEVRHADWEVDQQMFNIEVLARPDQIPSFVEVDISSLTVGSSIRVGDLVLPKGVEAVADPAVAVVATHAGRAAKPVAAGGGDAPTE